MDSHVVMSGEVSGPVRIVEGGGEAWLSLRGEGGSFFVKAFDPQLVQACRSLQPGDTVTVVGQLRSFVHKRCGNHHVWIKALSIARGTPPPAAEPPVAAGPDVMDTSHVVAAGGLVEWVIREYTERYRRASQLTSTYAYTLYPANGGCVIEWAGALAPIAGYRPDEVAGDWTRMIAPEDVPAVREHVRAILSRAGVIEFRVITKDGDVRWIRDHGSPVQESGATVRVYGAAQDITEFKRLEARLLRLQEMVLVGRLAKGIAYDLNDLLTVIGCHAEFLLHPAGDERIPPGADAREILDACRRAARLTKRLLGLGHRQMLQPELLDLNVLVAEVGGLVRRVTRGIELELTLDPALGCIQADQGQAEQLVANLIIHACDRMPEGGKLVIETGMATMAEGASDRPGPYVVLRMICAAPAAGKIWDCLDSPADTQVDAPASLNLACEAARRIGALIRVADVPEGATLDVYMPQVEEAGESPRITCAPCQRGPETVLLVENENMVREVVRRALLEAGYQVLEAQRGDEVLRLCEEYAGQTIRLALVEAVLPGGMAVSQLVERMAAAYPRMKIILMSDVEPDPSQNVAFLQKPFTHGELLWMVREALAGVE